MQHVGQAQQLLALALHQFLHRDAGPAGHDAGDFLVGHAVAQQAALLLLGGQFLLLGQLFLQVWQLAVLQLAGLGVIAVAGGFFDLGLGGFHLGAQVLHLADGVLLVLPLGLLAVKAVPQLGQLLLQRGQPLPGKLVGLLLQAGLLDLQLGDAAVQIVQLGGHRVHLGLDHGAGLVHQVDGLVGQKPVGDVPVGQGGGGDQRAVLDLDAVEHLVPLFQAAQDRDGVLHRGLLHHHRLETALQSGVLLDIFAVLVQRGGADAVQLAAGQHGL